MYIDLIIPARNVETNIQALAQAIPGGLFRKTVLVDMGSDDRTAEMAKAMGWMVLAEPEGGYGAACLRALAWMTDLYPPPDAVAFLGADLADEPVKLRDLCEPIVHLRADFVLASRVALAERGSLPFMPRTLNRVACYLIRRSTGFRYTDLGPMRVIRWSSLQKLKMQERTCGWNAEMQFKAAREELDIVEIDVPYRVRPEARNPATQDGGWRVGRTVLRTILHLSPAGQGPIITASSPWLVHLCRLVNVCSPHPDSAAATVSPPA